MDPEKERELLERFAQAANNKVLMSQGDLDPKDRPMTAMLEWCAQQGDIIVMDSGLILTSNPTSRSVQNCKNLLLQKGIRPGRVLPATRTLITLLLSSAEHVAEEKAQAETAASTQEVSSQQQRLRLLIKEAIAADVSDIHVEVRTDTANIRFRKHGELYLHAEWFTRVAREIASVAFNKETDHATAHFNPLVPQNASMPLDLEGKEVRLRLASMPAHGGFDMVMRILSVGDDTDTTLTLGDLGYTPDQVAIIERATQMPHGAVLLAGPTGSGKTTTLAACMNLVKPSRKIYTMEDPVEKVIEHATQVPVNAEQADRSFASFGKQSLRMDPDYLVLGEMRDEDTARVMLRASITGHMVFSTIHTNTAPGIVTRLVDMNISPNLLSDSNVLVALICQRLAAKLCDSCAMPLKKAKAHEAHMARWQKVFGKEVEKMRARGETECDKCRSTGIGGRTVVAEVIWVDDVAREYIQKLDIIGWEKHLKSVGWMSYPDHAMRLAREGVCDPFDVEKIVGEINPDFGNGGVSYSGDSG